MNLILLFSSDFISPDTVSLTGRRLKHALEILKPKVNDALAVGVENGDIGVGRVMVIDPRSLTLKVSLENPPPLKLPVVLCVALMRPIVLKRVLLTAASMGVEEIVIFHSRRVEKSFWQSTALADNEIREQLILGLEQAKDTVLPRVSLQKKFKPFVEDVLPGILKGRCGVVADPSGDLRTPGESSILEAPDSPGVGRFVLIIGPEGGFISYELEKFRDAGCCVIGLGKRILKVETAIVALLSKLF